MNITPKRAVLTVAILSATAASSWAAEYGRVISSTPVVASVTVPQRECSDQPVSYRAPPSGAGALIGAIAGAAVGNSFGGGAGRAAATGLGLFAGSVIGNEAEANSTPPVTQTVRQCRTVTQYENRTVGYDVVYEYQGVRRQTRLARDPGDRIALNVDVAPSDGALPPPQYSGSARARGDYVAPPPEAVYPAPYSPAPYYPAPNYPAPNYPAPYYQAPYPAAYYPAPYYGNVWPAVGVGIVIGSARGGYGYRHWR